MTQRRLWVTLFVVSIIVTLIGLGFAVYNYYVFDKPFMTTTTKGLLAAFFLCATMVAISLVKIRKRCKFADLYLFSYNIT